MRESGVQAGIKKFATSSYKAQEHTGRAAASRQKRSSSSKDPNSVSLLDLLSNSKTEPKESLFSPRAPSQLQPFPKKPRAVLASMKEQVAAAASNNTHADSSAAIASIKLLPPTARSKARLQPPQQQQQPHQHTRTTASCPAPSQTSQPQRMDALSCRQAAANTAAWQLHELPAVHSAQQQQLQQQHQQARDRSAVKGLKLESSTVSSSSPAQASNLQPCPLCGVGLPSSELQQHVEEELQELEEQEQQQLQQAQKQRVEAQDAREAMQWLHPNQQHKQSQWPQQGHYQVQQQSQPHDWPKQHRWQNSSNNLLQQPSRQHHQQGLQHQSANHEPQQPRQSGIQNHAHWGNHDEGQQKPSWQGQQEQRQDRYPAQQQQHQQQLGQRQDSHNCQQQENHHHQQQERPHRHTAKSTASQQRRQLGRSAHRAVHSRGRAGARSTVQGLCLAPSRARSSSDEPPAYVLDSFDHWGDSASTWMDDSMIGLEGAPRSEADCWEGLGSCAIGPRHLG